MESRHRKIPLSVLHFLAIVIRPERNTGDKAFPHSEEEPGRASNSVPVSKSEVGEYVSKYYGVDSGTAASTLQSYEVDSGITESIRILNIDHEMAESVHGTEKRLSLIHI